MKRGVTPSCSNQSHNLDRHSGSGRSWSWSPRLEMRASEFHLLPLLKKYRALGCSHAVAARAAHTACPAKEHSLSIVECQRCPARNTHSHATHHLDGGRFNIRGGDGKNAVGLDALLGSLKDSASFGGLKEKVEKLERKKLTLSKPLSEVGGCRPSTNATRVLALNPMYLAQRPLG
jgi:hypothetical protein